MTLLKLYGGPSQHEPFGPKPDVAEKIRGKFRPIASRTPGYPVGEHLPRLAGRSDAIRYMFAERRTEPKALA